MRERLNINFATILLGIGIAGCLAHFLGKTEAQPPGWGPYPSGKTGGSTIINNNGNNLTNLLYAYTTNSVPTTGVLTFGGQAYKTNIQADITLALFGGVSNQLYETIVLFVTNSTSSDHTVTMPSGVVGQPGSAVPAVFYCTNKVLTKIYIDHYGRENTNAWKQDIAP